MFKSSVIRSVCWLTIVSAICFGLIPVIWQQNSASAQVQQNSSEQVRQDPQLQRRLDVINGLLEDGSPKAQYEAFELAKEMAADDIPEAQMIISKLYADGIPRHVEKSEIQAFTWMHAAAKLNYWPAQLEFGRFFEVGIYVRRAPENAVEWYERALENAPAGEGRLASIFLGKQYFFGESGVVKNYNLAARYLKRASDHPAAAYMLGYIYETGLIGEKQASVAGNYYRSAIANPYNYSLVANPFGKVRDYSEWRFNGGSAKGAASFRLAFMEYNGDNIETLIERIEYAAEEGVIPALRGLGAAYEFGFGPVPVDAERARQLYMRAVNRGDSTSAFLVGRLFFSSNGIGCDLEENLAFLESAANDGHQEAQLKLGSIYEGALVPDRCDFTAAAMRDLKKSSFWYRKARENGASGLDSKIAAIERKIAKNEADFQRQALDPSSFTFPDELEGENATNSNKGQEPKEELTPAEIAFGIILGAIALDELSNADSKVPDKSVEQNSVASPGDQCRSRLQQGFYACTVETDYGSCGLTGGCNKSWSCWQSQQTNNNGRLETRSIQERKRYGKCRKPGNSSAASSWDFVCDPETGKKANDFDKLVYEICG